LSAFIVPQVRELVLTTYFAGFYPRVFDRFKTRSYHEFSLGGVTGSDRSGSTRYLPDDENDQDYFEELDSHEASENLHTS
jgi:hypothetical protein